MCHEQESLRVISLPFPLSDLRSRNDEPASSFIGTLHQTTEVLIQPLRKTNLARDTPYVQLLANKGGSMGCLPEPSCAPRNYIRIIFQFSRRYVRVPVTTFRGALYEVFTGTTFRINQTTGSFEKHRRFLIDCTGAFFRVPRVAEQKLREAPVPTCVDANTISLGSFCSGPLFLRVLNIMFFPLCSILLLRRYLR